MKVGTADRAGCHLDDGVAWMLDFRIGDGLATQIVLAVPCQCFHEDSPRIRLRLLQRATTGRNGCSSQSSPAPDPAPQAVLSGRRHLVTPKPDLTLSVDHLMADALAGTVVAVSSDSAHRFSKGARPDVRLIENFDIEGDAHAGPFVKHRFDARRTPSRPNLRQIHLIQCELFSELKALGFVVRPGELGENVTTRDLDLLRLPLTCRLHLGSSAASS
jgi:hypothetical protein